MLILHANDLCLNLTPLLRLIGQALLIFKVSLPVVLIVLGVFDISKAVISSKSSDVKKNMKNLVKKIVVCIMVFFIPTIGMLIFNFIDEFADIKKNSGIDYNLCYDCIFKPNNKNCITAASVIEEND